MDVDPEVLWVPAKTASKRSMSAEHKAALAEGRKAGAAVRAYLDALEAHRPKRGRRRTKESIEARLASIEDQIPDAEPLKRVSLIQDRNDLQAELDRQDETTNLDELEQRFIEHAADYSARKGISYAAWREVGVPAAALKAAGISR